CCDGSDPCGPLISLLDPAWLVHLRTPYPASTATTPRRMSLMARFAAARISGVGAALRTWSSRSSTCRHQRTKSPADNGEPEPVISDASSAVVRSPVVAQR